MSTKTKGTFRNAWGSATESIGNTFRIGSMQRSGLRSQARAKPEKHGGAAAGYVEGTTDRVAGRAKSTVGALTGNHSLEARGHAQQAKGDAQQTINRHI